MDRNNNIITIMNIKKITMINKYAKSILYTKYLLTQ